MSSRITARVAINALAIAGLVGVGLWGHQHGWKMPKFSQVNGAAAKEKADWCEEHSVPESICVECNHALMPRDKSHEWCDIHGVHECPLCHPEVAQPSQPDKQYRVTAEDLERAKRALATRRPVNKEESKVHERRIQFVSEAALAKAGISTQPVTQREIEETIPIHGEIIYDPARVAHLSPRAGGNVARVFKHLGDPVSEGDVLALVEAADVGKAKDLFAQACTQMDVKRADRERLSDASTAATVAAADAAVRESRLRFRAARQTLINLGLPRSPEDFRAIAEDSVRNLSEADLMNRLHFLGIPDASQKGLNRDTDSNNLLPMRSPGKGRIVSREIVPGEVVDPGQMVFEVVDNSRVWLMLNIRAEDVGSVVPGESVVRFTPDGHRREVKATITLVSIQSDPATRTVKARAELDNDGTLLANTFGTGQIVLRHEPNAIVVPSAALHWADDCFVVFVRDRNWTKPDSYKVFHTRVVRVGKRDERYAEIIAGVLPNEEVAVKGSEVLRAELLRANFGEGCGCCK